MVTTRADLWKMIWQEGTLLIVMTTKEMERGKLRVLILDEPEMSVCIQLNPLNHGRVVGYFAPCGKGKPIIA